MGHPNLWDLAGKQLSLQKVKNIYAWSILLILTHPFTVFQVRMADPGARHRELAQQIQTSGRGMEAVEFEEKNKNNSEFWIESTQFAGAAEM